MGKETFGEHVGKTLPICLSNLLIFFIVGVWHGAAWKYIMYGMYNGVIIAAFKRHACSQCMQGYMGRAYMHVTLTLKAGGIRCSVS